MNSSSTCLHPGIAVGGIKGGSGKTFFAVGLIQALLRRGFSVSPFKKGPDYIDPAWLSRASGRQCRNLDAYLMPKDAVIGSFLAGAADTDYAVLEGNRGLFDGLDVMGTYSVAELAKWLGIPLLLVLDCSKSSRTMAALLHGLENFDKDLSIGGVILNQIAGERHKKIITDSIEKYCRTPVLGVMPRLFDRPISERHMGLMPVSEHPNPDVVIKTLGDAVESNVDIKSIIEIAECKSKVHTGVPLADSRPNTMTRGDAYSANQTLSGRPDAKTLKTLTRPAIGVIRDSAFNFYYNENLDALKGKGADVIELNSISDEELPMIDALYIGGGFPETNVELISKNTSFRENLRRLVDNGLPVYAECGGLIYLSDSILIDNKRFPMTGIFPFVFELSDKPIGHGYTLFEVDKENPFYRIGAIVRGHEFRYSRIVNTDEIEKATTVFRMRRGTGIGNGRDGILYKRCLATFSHTHAYGENIQWIDSIHGLMASETIR